MLVTMDAVLPDPDAPPPADSGLRCPKCDYNLTGVAENRCPECGEAFDPERLRAILAGAPAPIPIWDDKSIPVAVRFIRMCLLTWFAPRQVGRMFPFRYSSDSARRFRWMVVAVSAAICLTAAGLTTSIETIGTLLCGSIVYLVSIAFCEAVVAAGLRPSPGATRSSVLHPSASDSLAGLVGLFRSYVLLEAVVATGSILAALFRLGGLIRFTPLAIIVVSLWWAVALALATAAQPGQESEGPGAFLVILVATLLSFFIAVLTGSVLILVVSIVSLLGS
jgi:hypothetical protein